MRLEVELHRNAAVLVRIAERKIDLADTARHQRGLRCRHAARGEGAPTRLHDANHIAVHAPHGEMADDVAIIWPLALEQAIEGEPVMGDIEAFSRFDFGNVLGTERRHYDNAEERDADA